jgi:hypothetical protein
MTGDGGRGAAALPTAATLGHEVRGGAWVMAQLASASALHRCRIGIPDTVLVHEGAAEAWLFTSKSGEVLRKRSVVAASIVDRFQRLALTNPNNPHRRAAILRYSNGVVQYVGHQALRDMMQKFPLSGDNGLVGVQCFIQSKGLGGTVYRNTYK